MKLYYRIQDSEETENLSFIVVDASPAIAGAFDSLTIADVNQAQIAGELRYEQATELIRRANSAPELLDALEAVVRKLEKWPGDDNPEFFPSVRFARAAIAKARGE